MGFTSIYFSPIKFPVSIYHYIIITSLSIIIILCEGNLPVTGGFPSQMASKVDGVSCHGVVKDIWRLSIRVRADSRLRPANERRRYFVTTSLIGWEQT